MNAKPFKLISNAKRKKPSLIGRYKTRHAAEQAKAVCEVYNRESRELQRKHPYIEDLYCDLEIIDERI